MKILIIVLGILFGAVEFLLTKTISERATSERNFILPLVGKLLSYGVVIGAVFLVRKMEFILPFGISAGGAVLVTGLTVFIYHIVKEKR